MSVHQVLADAQRGDQRAPGKPQLRLLDIRRIDLHSSGWETFYVKRAVDDWLRDPRLNMGECRPPASELYLRSRDLANRPTRPLSDRPQAL